MCASGQLLLVRNSDSEPTTGAVRVPAGATFLFAYVGRGGGVGGGGGSGEADADYVDVRGGWVPLSGNVT